MNQLLFLLTIIICFGCGRDKNESQQIDDKSVSYLTAQLIDNIKFKNQSEQDSISLNLNITNKEIIIQDAADIILLETVTVDGRLYQSIIGIRDSTNVGFPTFSFTNPRPQTLKVREVKDLGNRLQIAGTAEVQDEKSDFNLFYDKSFDGSKDPWEYETK